MIIEPQTQTSTPVIPLVSQTSTAPALEVNKPLSLTVVIPSYNRPVTLLYLLRSLYQTSWQYGQQQRLEIVVQDDCSPDFDVMDLLQGQPAKPQRNEKNLGFAGNCNAGALRAAGDILLFLNQDCIARPGWFDPLMLMFDDPEVGIVGPKLVIPTLTHDPAGDTIQSCGGLYDAGKGPYHRYIGYAADYWLANMTQKVSWTTGAALAIPRKLFYDLQGYDVAYERGYFEDVDLCEKVKHVGNKEIWYTPNAVFEHSAGSTGGIPAHIFKANSMRFHSKWDRYITPDINAIKVNY